MPSMGSVRTHLCNAPEHVRVSEYVQRNSLSYSKGYPSLLEEATAKTLDNERVSQTVLL